MTTKELVFRYLKIALVVVPLVLGLGAFAAVHPFEAIHWGAATFLVVFFILFFSFIYMMETATRPHRR